MRKQREALTMNENIKLPSDYLSDYLNSVDKARVDYKYCLDAMKREDCLTQDYLHMLELENLTYHENYQLNN